MIVKKLIEVEKICCEICGEEIPQTNLLQSTMISNLHIFFNYCLSDEICRTIEITPFCLCPECQSKYLKEIAKELLETYKLKLTEIKLRRN